MAVSKAMICDEYRRLFEKYAALCEDAAAWGTAEGAAWQTHGETCEKCIDWIRGNTVRGRGFRVDDFPCVHMAYYATFQCDTHGDPWECPDCVIVYSPRIDEYGIPLRDGGNSVTGISHCPWCGIALPPSKREAYLAELASKGIAPTPFNEKIPEPLTTDAWWRGRAVFPSWWPYVREEEE